MKTYDLLSISDALTERRRDLEKMELPDTAERLVFIDELQATVLLLIDALDDSIPSPSPHKPTEPTD